MIVCLHCYRGWADGTTYCGTCGRTFGGRRCPTGHLNPPIANVCLTCGDRTLTVAAKQISTSSLARLLTFISALLILRYCCHHAAQVSRTTASDAVSVFAWLTGTSLASLIDQAAYHCFLYLAVMAGIYLIFPPLRPVIWALAKTTPKILKVLFRGVMMFVKALTSSTKRLLLGRQVNVGRQVNAP